ncbi:MAG: ferrous iron transport protein B, partial [Candidatus Thermoplasmatota archaeon]|nr:ferrous iron transport protein B [Candidatus Thermoplasmatota archaeon]
MKGDIIKIALAGNPNVGKTTLFNSMTGARQHVGNWPGVTVEKKVGKKKWKGNTIQVIDLPGTYSLTAYSPDEKIVTDFLVNDRPDVVIHIVDATNLERNLFLTSQLMDLGVNVIVSLNMCDLAEEKGDKIDIDALGRMIGAPVIRTVANKGSGIDELLNASVEIARSGTRQTPFATLGKNEERMIRELSSIISSDRELIMGASPRWMALKVLEGDEDALEKVMESKVEPKVRDMIEGFDHEDFEMDTTDKRYEAIGKMVKKAVVPGPKKLTRTEMIDTVLTNKYLGIPIFLAIMWGVFEITFTFAAPFMDLIDLAAGWSAEAVVENISPDWLGSLLGDGIIGGVGAVVIFVPNIFILFFMISLLESSGYMARAAFIMDKLMYKIGLSGKSFIPMLMGFGCNVPAIMATRSIKDEKDRLITILINPFISCGARLPVYILFAGIYFGRGASNVIFILYFLGIAVAILSAKLFRSTILKGKPAPFIMELPPYRAPTLKGSLIYMWEKGSMYLKKAGTVILVGVVFIWIIASFTPGLSMAEEFGSEETIAGELGKFIQPIFEPLGFDWKIAVALIFGFIAKEIVVGGLGVLYGAGEDEEALTDRIKADSGMNSL